jgi:hypothetical protein
LTAGLASLALFASPATAAPNPIQAENAQTGTSTWKYPEAVPPSIEGYASEASALPGDTLHFHISTRPRANYRIEIYRLGWYGGVGARLLACLPSCATDEPGSPQPQGSPEGGTGLVRPGWPVTDTLTIPPGWVSGYLLVRFVLKTGQAATTYVILREMPTHHSAILVQVPVNTWQAYNGWGGLSLYEFDYSPNRRANHVSFDRPFAWLLQGAQNPLVWEYPTVRYLERMGYDISYQTDVDTHRNPGSLMQHRLILVNGHDEYWTKEMFDAFDGARNRGTNLAFMGANDAYWQVRYEDAERTIVSYKSFVDPIADPGLKTVRFRELSPPRYECTLIGIQHQGGLLNWPVGDYTVSPTVLADPWLANTGFRSGDTIRGVVSVEVDTIPSNGSPTLSCTHPLTVFFHRELGGDTRGNADAIRYVDPSGARVFASGSHQFSWALDGFRAGSGENVPADPRVQKFMSNALADLTRPAPPSSLRAAAGPSGVSLTATVLGDPRVTGERIVRYSGGSTTPVPVCETPRGSCVDHPPGHRVYTYAATADDPWGESAPTPTAPVAVRNSPPVVTLHGPRRVVAGRKYTYVAIAHDRDGDRVALHWRFAGAAEPGARARRVFRFTHAGVFRIEVRAADGYRGVSRAVLDVVAR